MSRIISNHLSPGNTNVILTYFIPITIALHILDTHNSNSPDLQSVTQTRVIFYQSNLFNPLVKIHNTLRKQVSIPSKTVINHAQHTKHEAYLHAYNQPCSNHSHVSLHLPLTSTLLCNYKRHNRSCPRLFSVPAFRLNITAYMIVIITPKMMQGTSKAT